MAQEQTTFIPGNVITGVLVLESSFIQHYSVTKRAWQERMAGMAAAMPPTIPEAPILLRAPIPGEPSYLAKIDVMLFAQDRSE